MTEFVAKNEMVIRLAFFFGIFAMVALAELVVPRRKLTTSKGSRWFANIGIVVIDSVVLRLLFPAAAVGTAIWVEQQGWGIFNSVNFPYWLKVVSSAILLDFVIYLQHVMFHAVTMGRA